MLRAVNRIQLLTSVLRELCGGQQRAESGKLSPFFYHLSRNLKLASQLSDQLKRAAVSVVCNLAEGRGKPTRKDQLRFFHIAFGSVRECQAILEMAELLRSEHAEVLDKLAAQLYRLIRNAR